MIYTPVVVIGPSGAGKSSIVKILREKYNFLLIKTYTTRQKRDPSDTDHVFVSPLEFDAMHNNDQFLGTLDIFGYQYGLPRFSVHSNVVVLLRAPAVEEFLQAFPDATIVEIDAPLPILKMRLKRRGSSERFVPKALEEEIKWGRKIAAVIIDSSAEEVDSIARHIATEYGQ